jgi:hypothetical protein
MSGVILAALCLVSSGFWIYVFANFRDEEKHPKAKQSFGSEPGFIQVGGARSRHVIVLRRPAPPSKKAKTA